MINHNTTEIFFDNFRIPASSLIGEEGKGFRYILDGMNAERILVASEAVGDGRWFVRKATQYAKDRVVFGAPIGKNQAVQFPIARAWAELEAADMICRRAAALFDDGKECGADANIAKLLASEVGVESRRYLHADVWRVRLCTGIRDRAQMARGAAVSDRADLDQPHPRLCRPARIWACRDRIERHDAGVTVPQGAYAAAKRKRTCNCPASGCSILPGFCLARSAPRCSAISAPTS